MKSFNKSVLPILAATAWISISEFVRNEFLFKSFWVDHYRDLGLVFPSDPVNGTVWGIWSLVFATAIYIISRRFSLLETWLLSYVMGYILMWLVVWNLNVFPIRLLIFALPLSLLEAYLAAWIILKLSPVKNWSLTDSRNNISR